MYSTDFVALYRGPTVSEARLMAVTAEPEVVRQVIRALVGEEPDREREDDVPEPPEWLRLRDEAE